MSGTEPELNPRNIPRPWKEQGAQGTAEEAWENVCWRALLAWLLFLLGFDLLTIHSFPVPWIDEVMFSDPAASLLLKGHWASTAWIGRGDLVFWAGNSPAYSWLLIPWLQVFGVSAAGVRSLNYVLIVPTLMGAWVAVRRLNLVPCPRIRLAGFVALSLCYAVSYSVRCCRPDVFGMLLFALAAISWSFTRKNLACMGLFICSAAIPFAGLHYAFYMPVLLGALFWAHGKPSLPRITAVMIGGLVGGLLFIAYHQFFAGWDGLLASMSDVRSRRSAGLVTNVAQMLRGLAFRYYLGRPHFLCLFAAFGVLCLQWKRLDVRSHRALVLAAVFLVIPGVFVGAGAHFGLPYHWLAVAPGLIFLAGACAHSWEMLGGITKGLSAIIALGIALSGRPLFVGLGALVNSASYTRIIENAAVSYIQPGDCIYADWQLYYALKPLPNQIYFQWIVPRLTPDELKGISLAFVPDIPDQSQKLTEKFGGLWTCLDHLPVPRELPLPAKLASGFSPGFFYGTRLAVFRRGMLQDLGRATKFPPESGNSKSSSMPPSGSRE